VSSKYGVPSTLDGKSNPEYRRRQYAARREDILEKTTAYYYAHRDKAIARRKAAYHKDRDATVKRRREYTREHRDEIRESQRLWRLEHGDEVRARNRAAYHNGQKRSHRANKYRVCCTSETGTCASFAVNGFQPRMLPWTTSFKSPMAVPTRQRISG
jgi:hypothetical protein